MVMKNFLFVCVFGLTLVSCSSDEGETEKSAKEETVDYSEMSVLTMDTFNLDLKMMVPNVSDNAGGFLPCKMEEVDAGSKWKLSISLNNRIKYALFIEDAKFEYEMAKEAGTEPNLLAEKKEELAGIPHYEVEYLEETPDYMLYKISIPTDPTIKPWHQVFGMVPGNETVYKVYSDDMIQEEFAPKPRADKMLRTIRSMLDEEAFD